MGVWAKAREVTPQATAAEDRFLSLYIGYGVQRHEACHLRQHSGGAARGNPVLCNDNVDAPVGPLRAMFLPEAGRKVRARNSRCGPACCWGAPQRIESGTDAGGRPNGCVRDRAGGDRRIRAAGGGLDDRIALRKRRDFPVRAGRRDRKFPFSAGPSAATRRSARSGRRGAAGLPGAAARVLPPRSSSTPETRGT